MSFWQNIFGDNNNLTDKDVAMDMLKDSKFGVETLSTAATECINPQLRNILREQLDSAVKEHFQLSDMIINKGWYPAHDTPYDQLSKEYNTSKELS